MSDLFDIPEKAIRAFEKWTGLTVCIHDLEGSVWPFLPPDRFHHHRPLCQAIKRSEHAPKCFNFEISELRARIGDYPEGRIQVCHAGLVEWMAPVFAEDRVAWILFAGQRTPGRTLRNFVRDSAPKPEPSPWPRKTPLPLAVEADDAEVYLEGLRQLAARLKLWKERAHSNLQESVSTGRSEDIAMRRLLILRFVQFHYAEKVSLRDLAKKLHLSESRAAHVVLETFGKRFGELITEARLRGAASLLRHSNLSITEVASRNGFEDPSRFHRLFKERMGTTPRNYRVQAE